MNPTDFDDPLSFHLAPSAGQNVSNPSFYDQIPAKIMTFMAN